MKKSEWQVVGEVAVDTGRIVIVDPCYLSDAVAHEDDVQSRLATNAETDADFASVVAIRGPFDSRDAGAVIRTGGGDGLYPVEARFEDDVVAEVRIRFLPHPAEAAWNAAHSQEARGKDEGGRHGQETGATHPEDARRRTRTPRHREGAAH